jgi:AAA15 family ATPase/GTPase
MMSDKTILLGKNNEGKSNLLKALNIAMTVLSYCSEDGGTSLYTRRQHMRSYRMRDETVYSWERDFPIVTRNMRIKEDGHSTFRLTFRLTQAEIEDFQKQIHSKIDGTLPIEIEIGSSGISSRKIAKRGKGGTTLTEKFSQIALFICDRISLNYIPAIRTNNESMTIVRRMLGNELTELENRKDYLEALETINSLQRPILDKLEKEIQESLKVFLPSVNSVKLDFSEENRKTTLRSDIKVIIDDGTATDIEYKGDGVKSLVALSLLNSSPALGKTIVIIEEPESHLHPEAIHNLSKIIENLAKENQVILSTHNPLFVDRKNIRKNVLVQDGKANPARDINDIREILGVKISDNLYNANFVLLVEGESDRKALTALLPALSKKLEKSFAEKMIVVRKIRGTGNLSYELNSMKTLLCATHVFLDDDKAGHMAFELAQKDNLINMKDVNFSVCAGMSEAEFEDCLDIGLYVDQIFEKYGVPLKCFRSSLKWSERVKNAFSRCGKPWNKEIEDEIKELVADSVVADPMDALDDHKRSSIDALVKQLEDLIK